MSARPLEKVSVYSVGGGEGGGEWGCEIIQLERACGLEIYRQDDQLERPAQAAVLALVADGSLRVSLRAFPPLHLQIAKT